MSLRQINHEVPKRRPNWRERVDKRAAAARSHGGRRIDLVSDEERAEQMALKRRLLELARQGVLPPVLPG
jgi:transcription elongation GreA/GreB family factor